MTPEEMYEKYKTMSYKAQRELSIMLDILIDWDEMKDITFQDAYLESLRNKVSYAMRQAECMI